MKTIEHKKSGPEWSGKGSPVVASRLIGTLSSAVVKSAYAIEETSCPVGNDCRELNAECSK